MSKEKIIFPEKIEFFTEIPIRKIDLSMDLHVSFASILDLVFEAHLQFFEFLGYSVTDIHGRSIIFANLSIDYQGELFYKDKVRVDVAIDNMQDKYMDLYFRLQKGENTPVGTVKIRVLFFDYSSRKVVSIPTTFRERFPNAQNHHQEKSKSKEPEIQAERKWNELKLRKLMQTLAKEVYEYTTYLPSGEEESLFHRLRSLVVSSIALLSQSYHNKIYAERMKSILRLEASLWELNELLEFVSSMDLAVEKIPKRLLGEIIELVEEFRIRSLAVKKVSILKNPEK
jgi:acyl-CoA thioesterase FadM